MSQARQSWRRGSAQQAHGGTSAQRSPPPGHRVYPSAWTSFPDGCLAQADIDQARTWRSRERHERGSRATWY
jgi:hypothetical protein